MTIKSLLLGSAAALAAVSGAQAADAIVAAEPEPMEYVKVCDAAGTGYFYIPGTETCMKFSGFIRYRGDYGFNTKKYRGRFQYEFYNETWNDTEFGAAYSLLRLSGETPNNGNMTTSADGYFGIGGLELGKYDWQWARFFGYGGAGITGGVYGGNGSQYVSYTADLGGAKFMAAIDALNNNKAGYVAAVSGALGDWNAALGFAYDTNFNGFTIKASAAGKVGIASVKVMAFYANVANAYNGAWGGTTAAGPYKGFSLLGSVSVAATDTVSVYGVAQWMQGNTTMLYGGVNWAVATGFDVQTEINYSTSTKVTNGIFRIRRSF